MDRGLDAGLLGVGNQRGPLLVHEEEAGQRGRKLFARAHGCRRSGLERGGDGQRLEVRGGGVVRQFEPHQEVGGLHQGVRRDQLVQGNAGDDQVVRFDERDLRAPGRRLREGLPVDAHPLVVTGHLEVGLRAEDLLDRGDQVVLAVDHGDARVLKRVPLALERTVLLPRRDDRPGVAHGLPGGSMLAGDQRHQRLRIGLRPRLDVRGEELLLGSADLARHDHEVGALVLHDQRHEVAEGGTDGPVAADADDAVLGDPGGGQRVRHVVEDGPAAGENGDAVRPGLVRRRLGRVEHVRQHPHLDPLRRENGARGVAPEEEGTALAGRGDDVADVAQGDPLGDQNDDRHAGLDGLEGRLPRAREMPPDGHRREIRHGRDAVGHGVEDRDRLLHALPAAPGGDAARDQRPELLHQTRVPRALTAETDDRGVDPVRLLNHVREVGTDRADQVGQKAVSRRDG